MNNVLRNNFSRIFCRLPSVIIMLAITLLSIFLAVYMTGAEQIRGHIALVTDNSAVEINSSSLSIEVMEQDPPMSQLVSQKYDAIVTDRGNGQFDIKTLRGNDFKEMLQLLLQNPQAKIPAQKNDRSVGVNIIGFLMVFLGTSVFFYFFPFADDKEQNQILRIAASPLSFRRYLAAHFLFCLFSFVPSFGMLAIMKGAGWEIGFSLPQYAGLLLLLAMLGSTFALFLNTFIKKPDNANMFGNSILIVTSTLAGAFYSFSKSNALLDNLIHILPQKQFLEFAVNLQNGEEWQHLFPLVYVVLFSAVMFGLAYRKLKHDYVERV